MAGLGSKTTWLTGESHFYLADSPFLSVGKEALAGFIPRVQGSLFMPEPASRAAGPTVHCVAGIQADPKYAAHSRTVASVPATLRKGIGCSLRHDDESTSNTAGIDQAVGGRKPPIPRIDCHGRAGTGRRLNTACPARCKPQKTRLTAPKTYVAVSLAASPWTVEVLCFVGTC
jgi:hypothetical protein